MDLRQRAIWGLIVMGLCASLITCGPTPSPPPPVTPLATVRVDAPPSPEEAPPSPSLEGASPSPMAPSPTAAPTAAPNSSPSPAPTTTPVPTPVPISGYWVRTTTREGLCDDAPRFIGYDSSHLRPFIGGSGTTICFWDDFGLERWPRDYPSPLMGFPSWMTAQIPHLGYVIAGTAFSPYAPPSSRPELPSSQGAVYGMPSFVGTKGQCVMDQEGRWHHFTSDDGLPFDDIRGYGIAEETNVEWFLSADRVASLGLQPEEQTYPLAELVGASEVYPTGLAVSRWEDGNVWVATDGHGVVRIEPATGRFTRYSSADGLPDDRVRDVHLCGRDCAWVATSGGVGHWDGASWTAFTTEDGLPGDDVRGVSTDSAHGRGVVWAATAAGPALLRGGSTWEGLPNFPPDVELTGVLYGDFSTRGQGLIRFIRAPVVRGQVEHFTTAEGLPSDQVTALAQAPAGVVVGTPAGAVQWVGYAWEMITDAAVNDAFGTLIGTDAGLWRWNGSVWEQVHGEHVLVVAEGEWYATADQVCHWVEGAAECPPDDEGQALAGVQALYTNPFTEQVAAFDAAGRQWLYDAEAGVFRPHAVDFMPRQINGLAMTEGLWYYAADEGVYYSPCDGSGCWCIGDRTLSGGWPVAVREVALDATGEITWIATDQGAFFHNWFDPRRVGPHWRYVAGLPSEDLTAVLPVLYDTAVWFGTADAGVIYLQPAGP